MTGSDVIVRDALDRLVPPIVDAGDWAGVLARAQDRGATARMSRRRLGLAAVAALLVVLLAPTFGGADQVLRWFGHVRAPERVKQNLRAFDRDPPPDSRWGVGVNADAARGIVAIDTSGAPAYLWAAPTRDGGWCLYVETITGPETAATADCVRPTAQSPLAGWVSDTPDGDPQARLLQGKTVAPIVSLELRFADGSTQPVPLTANGFFLHETSIERAPIALIGRDHDAHPVDALPLAPGPR
jgi:hypothetical protein